MAPDGPRVCSAAYAMPSPTRSPASVCRVTGPGTSGRTVREVVLEPPGRTRSRRQPGDGHAAALTDETAVMAAQHERALRRVAVAANEACEDWERGLDVDEAMVRLRAELQTAAEYEA